MVNFKAVLAIAFLALPVLSAALPHPREFTARNLEDIFTREFLDQLSISERGYFSSAFKKVWSKAKGSNEVKSIAAHTLHTLANTFKKGKDKKDKKDEKDETGPVTVAKNPRELEEEALDLRDDMLYIRDWEDLEELDWLSA